MISSKSGSLSSRTTNLPSLFDATHSPPLAPCIAKRWLTSTPASRSASIRSLAVLGSFLAGLTSLPTTSAYTTPIPASLPITVATVVIVLSAIANSAPHSGQRTFVSFFLLISYLLLMGLFSRLNPLFENYEVLVLLALPEPFAHTLFVPLHSEHHLTEDV